MTVYPKALALARTAKGKLPEDPRVADTHALALLENGLYQSAINELTEATRKMPQHPTVLYHLGLAHWKNGDEERALEALNKALKSTVDFPEKQKAAKLLEEVEAPDRK